MCGVSDGFAHFASLKNVGPDLVGASGGWGQRIGAVALARRTGPDCIMDTTLTALIFG